MARFEVITGPERRRRWTDEQERAIVAESLAPGAAVSEVARRADVRASQIYRWRRGMDSLAVQVQQVLKRDPHAGDLYVFRGKRGHLIKLSGMTGSACCFTPNGWSAAGSSGRRRPMGR